MNYMGNGYCRLCAELKPHSELANLQTDEETCQKVVNKLSRFNIEMDFHGNILPITICSLCEKSLEQAFAFVIAVEQAQSVLSDLLVQTRTAKSDAEFTFLEPTDCIDIKAESCRDPVDVNHDGLNLSGERECDVHNDGEPEEFNLVIQDDSKSYGFVDEKIHIKDSSAVNDLDDKSLNFSHDSLENQFNVVSENNFDIQGSKTTNSHLKVKCIIDIEQNSNVNLQLNYAVYSADDINTVEAETISSKQLDYSEYSDDYVNKQINRLSTVPIQCLKQTWMEYEWKCSHCGALFTNIEELQKHSILYHNACNAYQCTNCKIKKQRLNAFLKHVRSHRKYLHYSCYKCFKKFPSIMEMRHHKTKIHENSKYVCVGCNTPFASNSEMEEHVNKYYNILWRKKTFISNDNLTCSTCNKVCPNVTALRNHLYRHKEKKKGHICDRCGKCFVSDSNLRVHMDTHTERVYSCDICKASFKTIYTLRYHASIHSGIKPFTCDVCNKCFRTKSHIRNHIKFHTDYLPFSCLVCDKKFRLEKHLQNHMLQHTGEKPFSCDICPRDFTNLPNRNKHMRRRHGIEMAKRRQPIIIQPVSDNVDSSNVITGAPTSGLDKMGEWKNNISGRQRKKT